MTAKHHVLFAGRSVFHFPYYESICEGFVSRGARITFVYDSESSRGQSDKALREFLERHHNSCTLTFVPSASGFAASILRVSRELRAYCHYLRRKSGSNFYVNRQSRYLPGWLRWIARIRLLRFLFSSRQLSAFLEALDRWIPVDSSVRSAIQRISPTVMFASPINMRFSREVDFIKAGNSMGIPTFGLVQTWDNLTTKGIFHVRPSHIFCWNDQHLLEATEIHGFPTDSVSVVGAPFYDKWFNEINQPPSRTETMGALGLTSDERYILYLGSSANIAEDESWLLERLLDAIRGSGLSSLRVVLRPHPVNMQWAKGFNSADLVVIDPSSSLPEDSNSTRHLAGVITHSQFAVGVNTSAMIDCLVLGKACVALLASRYSKTQMEALHFKMLRTTGALIECDTEDISGLTELITTQVSSTEAHSLSHVLPLVRLGKSTDLAGNLIADHVLNRLSRLP